MDLATPIQNLFMVGPVYAKRLAKLEIFTIEDLLNHFPFRYEDYSFITNISRIRPGEIVTIKAQIISIKNEFSKNGKRIQRAAVNDGTGEMEIIWFNQMFLTRTIKAGESYNFSGKADWFGRKIVMVSPEYEKINQYLVSGIKYKASEEIPNTKYQILNTIHTGRLVPVYPETYGVSSKWLRSRIAPLLKDCSNQLLEYLPASIIAKYELMDYQKAIFQIHFPDNKDISLKAQKRLAFDELFLIQLASQKRKMEWSKEVVGHKLQITNYKLQIDEFIKKLPFTLTNAQNRVLDEILADLAKDQPMNRLLEGDVGSGKTVVAAIAMYLIYLNGCQSLIMAPTEILANQHFETLKNMFEPFGVNVSLMTSSHKVAPCTRCNLPETNVFVGTHALLSEKNNHLFQKVGLVIIDEQHRFGVEQRAKLKEKGKNPHLLTMTATPIPRTVALTLYGELDLSYLDEMPLGRQKVKTWVVPPEKRQAAYEWIKKRVKGTREQAFIICPLIEESETLKSVRAVTKEFDNLKNNVFRNLRLGLLHGRLKSKEKEKIMQEFRAGDLDILVATPVVEVGLDIPDATIMMIEGSERFGLAQLHQLRGRVGRGNMISYCLLFSEINDLERLKAMERIYIGAQLAELDLKMRGSGEVYGTKQSGLSNLKIASLTDLDLIEQTKEAAQNMIPLLPKLPLLQEKLKKLTIRSIPD